MPDPLPTLSELDAMEKAATRPPWKWRYCVGGLPELVSPPGGHLLVMDAVRSGMSNADIRFAKRTDNMGGLMVPLAKHLPKPGKDRSDYIEDVGIADADFIPKIRNALPALLADIRRMREFVNDIAEYDCEYPEDPCLAVHISELGHGMCIGCKARQALAEQKIKD